jgi:multidrug resistance efflux pump
MPVKRGDVLLQIDTTKIDQAIRDLKMDREVAEIALRQAREELPVLEQFLPLNLAAAERDKRIAEEDLKRYREVDRALAQRNVEFALKSSANYLEYAREELKQLEKMYRDKDLREETEEIILKRQRNQVEAAEFRLETVKIDHDRVLNVDLPRKDQTIKDLAQKQSLAWQKAQAVLPLELNQKRLALRKLELEREKSAERQYQLEADRAAMTVRAPADGIVYHGQYTQGQWNTATASAKLRRNGSVQANDVFMTVVSPQPRLVRATVEEKDLHSLRTDLTGEATPVGYPDLKLPARLIQLSLAPRGAGNFEAKLAIEPSSKEASLLPGMACTVKFVIYRNDSALVAPAAAVFRDAAEDSAYVYVANNGQPHKTSVKTGKTSSGKTEIVAGLKAGDEIYMARP